MKYEAIIGLELHIEMKTKSKMFSSAPVGFGGEPNTRVAPLDMAFPGAMPLVNKQAVINGIRLANALHMNIDHEIWFDRKNYFYSDLAKGYQITQFYRPLGLEGYVDLDNNKRISIEKLILEEDTCKQIHYANYSALDYNRSGIPLIELVFKPELRSGEEALRYVEKIRSMVMYLDICNGKMEEGSLRCDVNISIREKGTNTLGAKVEIKNLNTLMNIKKAVEYEVDRQIKLISKGERVTQETRRFDEQKKQTVKMRLKTDSIDYKYFVDPTILPIKLSDEFINEAIKTSPQLLEQRLERYKSIGLNEYDCKLLLSNKGTSDYFDTTVKFVNNPKLVANWINVDVQTILKKNNIQIEDFPIEPERLGKLISLIEDKTITNKQAREIFSKMLKCSMSPEEFIQKNEEVKPVSEAEIKQLTVEILVNNPQLSSDFHGGKTRVVGYIIGQIMKMTDGRADPSITNVIVYEELMRR